MQAIYAETGNYDVHKGENASIKYNKRAYEVKDIQSNEKTCVLPNN